MLNNSLNPHWGKNLRAGGGVGKQRELRGVWVDPCAPSHRRVRPRSLKGCSSSCVMAGGVRQLLETECYLIPLCYLDRPSV